jgi:hypothetical protein
MSSCNGHSRAVRADRAGQSPTSSLRLRTLKFRLWDGREALPRRAAHASAVRAALRHVAAGLVNQPLPFTADMQNRELARAERGAFDWEAAVLGMIRSLALAMPSDGNCPDNQRRSRNIALSGVRYQGFNHNIFNLLFDDMLWRAWLHSRERAGERHGVLDTFDVTDALGPLLPVTALATG